MVFAFLTAIWIDDKSVMNSQSAQQCIDNQIDEGYLKAID